MLNGFLEKLKRDEEFELSLIKERFVQIMCKNFHIFLFLFLFCCNIFLNSSRVCRVMYIELTQPLNWLFVGSDSEIHTDKHYDIYLYPRHQSYSVIQYCLLILFSVKKHRRRCSTHLTIYYETSWFETTWLVGMVANSNPPAQSLETIKCVYCTHVL